MNALKHRLNIKGYTLYPVLEKMIVGHDPFKDEFAKKFGKELNAYLHSVVGAKCSEIEESKPPIICGSRGKLDKALAIILAMFAELQGKKFGIEDLKLIKSKKEEAEEEIDENFVNYEHLAIIDLHKNNVTSENMEHWRLEGVLELVSSRQRNRKPLVVVSEKPLGDYFCDESMFNYINVNLIAGNATASTSDTQSLQAGKAAY